MWTLPWHFCGKLGLQNLNFTFCIKWLLSTEYRHANVCCLRLQIYLIPHHFSRHHLKKFIEINRTWKTIKIQTLQHKLYWACRPGNEQCFIQGGEGHRNCCIAHCQYLSDEPTRINSGCLHTHMHAHIHTHIHTHTYTHTCMHMHTHTHTHTHKYSHF